MSNRLFQSVIYQMKDAAHRVFGVIDENGMVIACSDLTKIGELRMGLREEFAFHAGAVAKDGYLTGRSAAAQGRSTPCL